MNKILVTPRSITAAGWHPALDRLKASGYEVVLSQAGVMPTEADLCRLLPGCVGYLAGVEKVSRNVLRTASSLRVISRNGVGTDGIDLDAAQEFEIKVLNAPGSNARGVAELALAFVFSVARSISYSDSMIKDQQWTRKIGSELKGKTLGVIGCGRIGKELSLMALAIGMEVVAYEPGLQSFFTYDDRFAYAPLDAVVSKSDFISLHCPPAADGKPMVDQAFLAKLKTGAAIINTARGELVDEGDVLAALVTGTLGAYATDVYLEEPPFSSQLFRHEQVICTAHIGGYTSESVARAMEDAISNMLQNL